MVVPCCLRLTILCSDRVLSEGIFPAISPRTGSRRMHRCRDAAQGSGGERHLGNKGQKEGGEHWHVGCPRQRCRPAVCPRRQESSRRVDQGAFQAGGTGKAVVVTGAPIHIKPYYIISTVWYHTAQRVRRLDSKPNTVAILLAGDSTGSPTRYICCSLPWSTCTGT